jgi:hypothetical protein
MDILTAVLCDSAADYQGKLCILGTFDTILAPKLPATHPSCALALRFVAHAEDEGPHQITINLIDPDGRNLLPSGPIKLDFRLPPIPEHTFFTSNNCVINLQGLVLPKVASYSFDIHVDGELRTRIPLQVVQQVPGRQAPRPR